jgi:glycosyltransferase involved in cell wall biosynthesis
MISGALNRLGNEIDHWIARRADGWLALTHSAESVMRQFSNRPGALVPPSMPDPLDLPARLDSDEVARRHGLEPGRFLIYSGNLDGYQELDILAAAARRISKGREAARIPLVLASHSALSVTGWADSMPGVEFRRVASSAEMQALLSSARASLLLRRTQGGFPIKLVNSLAVGSPVLAFQEREWGLEHETNSLICSPTRPVETLVSAIERIGQNDRLAHRLADGARDLYLERHRPQWAAKQIWTLIEEVCRSHSRP